MVGDNGKTVMASLKAGSYFGEISILNMGTAGKLLGKYQTSQAEQYFQLLVLQICQRKKDPFLKFCFKITISYLINQNIQVFHVCVTKLHIL